MFVCLCINEAYPSICQSSILMVYIVTLDHSREYLSENDARHESHRGVDGRVRGHQHRESPQVGSQCDVINVLQVSAWQMIEKSFKCVTNEYTVYICNT